MEFSKKINDKIELIKTLNGIDCYVIWRGGNNFDVIFERPDRKSNDTGFCTQKALEEILDEQIIVEKDYLDRKKKIASHKLVSQLLLGDMEYDSKYRISNFNLENKQALMSMKRELDAFIKNNIKEKSNDN